jgi:class 3 adenylate cyclase
VTVLFADVANYTSMYEKLDPEEVHQITDGCFRILMDEIHKHEEIINQFTGDGVIALFGAPIGHGDRTVSCPGLGPSIPQFGTKYNFLLSETDCCYRVFVNTSLKMQILFLGWLAGLKSLMEARVALVRALGR